MIDQSRIANRVAAYYIAGKRPEHMFKALFYDIKEKAKSFTNEQAEKAIQHIDKALKDDLTRMGFRGTADVKLGKFKGHPYVSVAKLKIEAKPPFSGEDDERVKKLLNYLQKKYSPKFKFKSVKGGVATFNVR